MASGTKDLRWFQEWRKRGYTIAIEGGGHYKVRDPEGHYVTSYSASPSNADIARKITLRAVARFHRENRKPA